MIKKITSITVAKKLWIYSALALSAGIVVYTTVIFGVYGFIALIAAPVLTTVASLPAFIVLIFFLPLILKLLRFYTQRITALIFLFLLIASVYALSAGLVISNSFNEYRSLNLFYSTTAVSAGVVFTSTVVSFFLNLKHIKIYFLSPYINLNKMEEHSHQLTENQNQNKQVNKAWIKGLITAVLILVMLIPTMFVSNLVAERQARQQEVKNEVSSKWAGQQSITFPYLFIPYNVSVTAANGKVSIEKRSFIILPENLNVTGSVSTEERRRSIYSVLLYNSEIAAKGNFNIRAPQDVDTSAIDWKNCRICFGISDFKGIQKKVIVKINNNFYDLSAGLPTNEIDTTGLSSPLTLTADNLDKIVSFELPLSIKGSDQLHFAPLAGNSQFTLTSKWRSPSFDGNTLPSERNLNNTGFEANWNFNKANLPFNTVIKDFNFKKDDYAFGVTLLQPADQYAKTLRCVKYAILFIGLTFSLFFIIEIMQRKPFHPVQYVLVGMALIIFYTLLLSISEFLLFDIAYCIAATATVLLITLYAKSHFKSLKIAGVFAGLIGAVYAFIFVLIRLEDTALLVGSIGLFIILALAMYISRKINWYGNAVTENAII